MENEIVKKTRKKTASAQKKNSAPEIKYESASKERKSFLSTLIMIVATSLIVGGTVYTWQKNNVEKKVNQVKQETDSIKIDFENRLSGLKDKLSGVETENNSLKTTNDDLKAKVDLLADAKLNYTSPDLGVSFEYPASLGEVKLAISSGETGKVFKGEFSGNSKLFFGGVAADYSKATGTEAEFTDTLGYEKKKNVYYYEYAAEKNKPMQYKINPINIIKTKSGEALMVDKKSFVDAQEKPQININENIGAIINIKKGGFTGMAFVNQDLGAFSLIDFGAMLESMDVN